MKFILAATLIFILFPFHLFSNDGTLILADEQMAMDCKTDLMLQAKQSIYLSYYAINEDEVGLKYAAIACYKSMKGIDVKIIIEKSRSKVTRNLMQIFKEYGVEIKYYNSYKFSKTYKNFSWLHDKLMVIDSSYVILGGRNLNNKYYPNSVTATKLVDIETLLKGKSGAEAQKYINQLFISRFADEIKKKKLDSIHYKYLKAIIQQNIDSIKTLSPKNWDSLLSPVNSARFVHDNYKKWPKTKKVSNAVLRLITSAKTKLIVVSPYLIPPLKYMCALKAAKKRGVDITLISNSVQVSDAKIIAAAYMNDRRKYLKRHIKMYEYNGEKMLHDKLFIADDSVAIVGSYNFDNISYRMNSEVIAEIKDADFTEKIKNHIEERKLDCFEVVHKKDKNPYNDATISRKTKWNRILLIFFPFIRRFL